MRQRRRGARRSAHPPLRPTSRPRPRAPRREDPRRSRRPGGRAQAGDGAVRRRDGLDGARRAKRPRGVAADHGALLRDPLPRASTASRAPSTSSPATASWPCSARRSPTRTTPSAPATRRSTSSEELADYAAELRREQGLSFSVRMGLNSGEVVVGAIGDDLAMEYTAIGHTVGLAQRMEQLAEPGKAYLTEHTASLVRGLPRAHRPGRVPGQGRQPAAAASTS